jgi:hypothetical protein
MAEKLLVLILQKLSHKKEVQAEIIPQLIKVLNAVNGDPQPLTGSCTVGECCYDNMTQADCDRIQGTFSSKKCGELIKKPPQQTC